LHNKFSYAFLNWYTKEISLPCPHAKMGIANHWREMEATQIQPEICIFDAHKSKEANYNNVPEGVVPDQWIVLVNNWMTPKAQVHG
jgi:hypothetical protein